MSKPKVYIDGAGGAVGQQICQRLMDRTDIELLLIAQDKRRDLWERKRMFDAADIVFLCLPADDAAQVVELAEKPSTRIIDASIAHAAAPGWDPGFPELSTSIRTRIQSSKRVACLGCHATGSIACIYPLLKMELLPRSAPLSCFSLTGYSGGGKQMIARYEGPDKGPELSAPRLYSLDLQHKHLPVMQKICGLDTPPAFLPVVDDYYSGMAVTVSIHNNTLVGGANAKVVWEALSAHYKGRGVIRVAPFGGDGTISANGMAGKDGLTLYVNGSDAHTAVTALFDNLGKGSAGAAVQNMDLMLGFEETAGLNL